MFVRAKDQGDEAKSPNVHTTGHVSQAGDLRMFTLRTVHSRECRDFNFL